MLLFTDEISAREKAAVLQKAAEIMKCNTNGDCVAGTNPPIRHAIAEALTELRYWNMGVGGHREMSVTIEIQRAVGLPAGLKSVENWGDVSPLHTVLAGVDLTVKYLQ